MLSAGSSSTPPPGMLQDFMISYSYETCCHIYSARDSLSVKSVTTTSSPRANPRQYS